MISPTKISAHFSFQLNNNNKDKITSPKEQNSQLNILFCPCTMNDFMAMAELAAFLLSTGN
jgi:hypothetical protein